MDDKLQNQLKAIVDCHLEESSKLGAIFYFPSKEFIELGVIIECTLKESSKLKTMVEFTLEGFSKQGAT